MNAFHSQYLLFPKSLIQYLLLLGQVSVSIFTIHVCTTAPAQEISAPPRLAIGLAQVRPYLATAAGSQFSALVQLPRLGRCHSYIYRHPVIPGMETGIFTWQGVSQAS